MIIYHKNYYQKHYMHPKKRNKLSQGNNYLIANGALSMETHFPEIALITLSLAVILTNNVHTPLCDWLNAVSLKKPFRTVSAL